MSGKETLIKRYPFLTNSKNIIECFSVIGFEEKMLLEIIKDYKISKKQDYTPTILSSIISNEDFGIIDNDFIISQIFPENPELLLKSKTNSSQKEQQSKKIIHSLVVDSPDSTKEEKKIFYTCFAFIFYETFIYDNNENKVLSKEEYLIPKAFCIISQYSFFGLFNYICTNLYNLLLNNKKNDNNIPIEIILYNIINFTPIPLDITIEYTLFHDILKESKYNLTQLTGYPVLDFNLLELFNILPINMVVEIYLITLIEQSILFFSSNLEILNIIMFIFYCLNYPFNNSTYFWHIVSIPKKDFNEDNRFVGHLMASILGVNTVYDESIDTSPFGEYHFIVDIDKQKLIFKKYNDSKDEDNDANKIYSLYSCLHNIIYGINDNQFFLKKYINRLIESIKDVLREKEPDKMKKKNVDFFSKINNPKNILIQEYFYRFLINLVTIIHQNINFEVTVDSIKIKKNKNLIIQNYKNSAVKKEEQYFYYFFQSSSKYKLYFENFLGKNEIDEMFKIPYLLFEEFINLKLKLNIKEKTFKIPYFKIIDYLYQSISLKTTVITFIHYNYKFEDNELKMENIDSHKKYSFNTNQSKTNLFNINRNILQNYIYIINNYEEDTLVGYFPSIDIKKAEIPLINKNDIYEGIQNFFVVHDCISASNYLIYSSVYIYSILIPLFPHENILWYLNELLNFTKKITFFMRYYINILIQSFYKYYLINKETKKFPELTYDNVKRYLDLLFYTLNQVQILPNEEMLSIKKVFEIKSNIKSDNLNDNKKLSFLEIDKKNTKNILDLSDNNIFQICMKYNFDSSKIYKDSEIIEHSIKRLKDSYIKTSENKNLKIVNKDILILVKIKDKVYSEKLYSPKKIFKVMKKEYDNYRETFSLQKIDVKKIKSIFINLIQYSHPKIQEMEIPYDLFVNGLYLFNKFIENNI